MIEIRHIDAAHAADLRLPNEPFRLFGRMLPAYRDGRWSCELLRYAPEDVREMCFPDEDYRFEDMTEDILLGAYDGETCVGLAILEPGFFRYLYLLDLKVCTAYRRQHVGTRLIEAARRATAEAGYCGLYTQGQDNNPGACLFYLHSGFRLGGLDTELYRHTKQEGKADLIFYTECEDISGPEPD